MTTNTLGALSFAFKLDGSEVQWRLLDAYVEEGLNTLPMYTFDIATTSILPATTLSKDLVFELHRDGDDERNVLRRAGTVVGVEMLHRMDARHFRTRLRVSSRAFVLGIGRRARVFTMMTASDVLTKVCSDAMLTVSVQGGHTQREMCVQYHESDYDFLRRLCEDEGLTVDFEADGRKVTVRDLSTCSSATSAGEFHLAAQEEGALVDQDSVLSFGRDLRAVPRAVVGAAWVEREAKAIFAKGAAAASLLPPFGDTFFAPGVAAPGYEATASALQTAVRQRAESLAASHDLRFGTSNILALRAGAKFELVDDDAEHACSGTYFVTAVHHHFTTEQVEGGEHPVYTNRFECVPEASPHRPPRVVQRPVALAPETAVVMEFPKTEPGRGLGEVRVRFRWAGASGPEDAANTAWVRVAQLFADHHWGAQFLPREGQEVLVQFLGGDPDRPVITGAVYNHAHMPPAALEAHHSRSMIRTHSWGSAMPDNELFFEDSDGAEILGLVATRDHTVEVTKDMTVHVGANSTENIDGEAKQTVKKSQTLAVDENRTATVKGNEKLTVEKAFDATVKQNAKMTVFRKLTLSADEGIVLQCGDTKLELTPTSAKLVNAAGLKVEMTPSSLKVENPTAGSVEMTGPGVTVKSVGGGKVEIAGPQVNLN